MNNLFLDIVKEAARLNWCTVPYCTTCGSLEYRKALKKLSGDLGGPLADALTDLDLKEITKVPNWQGALLIALIELPISLQLEGILNAWLAKAQESDIDFLDLVLFKIIKNLPVDNALRKQWISHCTKLALQTKHPSLIESLVLALKHEMLDNPELLAVASKLAENSKQMQRALLNSCGLKIKNKV
jgi:hypothetical protein